MQSRRTVTLAALLVVSACASSGQQLQTQVTTALGPEPGAPGPIAIAAPVARIWDALVETGAARQWTPATLDRSSGMYQSGPISFEQWNFVAKHAVGNDCGSAGSSNGPILGTLTMLVRGDSTRGTIDVSARLVDQRGNECRTTGRWERTVWREVKARAEGQPVPAITWTEH